MGCAMDVVALAFELCSVCQKKVGGLKNGETRPFDTRSIHL